MSGSYWLMTNEQVSTIAVAIFVAAVVVAIGMVAAAYVLRK